MVKKIGVLTSGGDAPGMNAAVRAVVRSGLAQGLELYGVYSGFLGLVENKIQPLSRSDVSEKINRGGTFLGSARFPEFKKEEVRKVAIDNLRKHGIDALVVIGGDGSYMGAKKLTEMGFPCIGIPGTIDNDIPGTDYTIGFFTALNTVLDAVDKLRDTCSSHNRISVVEIMGRHCGDLALMAGIVCGAENVIVPEVGLDEDKLINKLREDVAKGKKHAIVAITENMCNVSELAERIEEACGLETRATILGHIQRGGAPMAFDRVLASRMGAYAVSLLLEGCGGRCIGVQADKLVNHDIIDALENMKREFRKDLFELNSLLT